MVNNKLQALISAFNAKDYDDLVLIISEDIKSILNSYPNINSISRFALSTYFEACLQLKWSVPNSYTYSQKEINLVSDLADKCGLALTRNKRGAFVFEGTRTNLIIKFNSPLPGDYLNKILEDTRILDHRTLYEIWNGKGEKVGKKQLWPSYRLIKLLRKYNLKNLNWPSSHPYPLAFSKLLKAMPNVIEREKGNKSAIEKWMSGLWREELQHADLVEIKVTQPGLNFELVSVQSIQSHQRHVPYFYVLATPEGSKIGAADKSQSRFTDRDFGLVVQLNFCDDADIALHSESNFALWLLKCEIKPVSGKRDYYKVPIDKMVKLALGYFSKKGSVKAAYVTRSFN